MTKKFTISDEKRQDIMAAADALEAEGQKVTIKSVIQFMGGGSFEYVSPVLRDRRQARKPVYAIPSELPEPVMATVEQLVKQTGAELWSAVSQLADEKIEQAQQAAQADREASEQQLSELESRYWQLVHETKALSTEKQRLEQLTERQAEDLRIKDQRLFAMQDKLEAGAERLLDSERTVKDLNQEYQALNERYYQEKDQTRETIEKQTTEIESLTADKAETEQSLQEATAAFATERQNTENKIRKLETTVAGLQSRIDDRSTQLERLSKKNREQAERIETLVKADTELKAALARIRELSIETGELKQENKRLYKESGELKARLDFVQQQVAATDDQPDYQEP
ncbi:DNA-binding protein [Endozoicomonas lisbonensis]|uniref:Colicin import membrane protein n=1 Tax=Endozoicomonas lisbonensis TaxID=3120522 RepID=A0ABV2SBZ0_9GAMM